MKFTRPDTQKDNLIRIVERAAGKVDKKHDYLCDSCLNFLLSIYGEIWLSPKCQVAAAPTCYLFRSLINRGLTYYKTTHLRFSAKREYRCDDDLEQLMQWEPNTDFELDLNDFLSSLNRHELTVWPVICGEKKGAELADELGISAEAVSKRKNKLKEKAMNYFGDYQYDRN